MDKLWRKSHVVLVLFFSVTNTVHAQDDFARIDSNITAYLKRDVDTAMKKQSLSLKEDGSWADIDYSSTAETNWAPLMHLNRIKQLVLNNSARNKTSNALRFWLNANPTSSNWFQNEIASPTAIGEILMLLKQEKIVPISLQDSLINRMKRGNVEKAIGANKLDMAIHMLYRACISGNKNLMDSAVNQAFMPITLSNTEGLQSDFSYRQHGPQLQISSYGEVFLIGEYKVASWLVGTSYAIPKEKLKILDTYLINTYLRTIRGRYIDFNLEGRGIARNNILDKSSITTAASAYSLLALAKQVNPNNSVMLTEAEQRISQTQPPSYQLKPGHSYFYKVDYTLHNRPGYSFNVRTVSKRTIRTETGNRENLTGKFLPDGSTNIQRSGSEYYNIMPIWEWDKIPGITSRDYAVDQKTTLFWGERGVGAFSGGTTDGVYGTSVYELNYNEVTAKKAWFFFDNEVVCLGTGINSFAKEAITTTVNQAWQKGKVKAFATDQLINADKGFTARDINWVWHDSIAYVFPNGGQLSLTTDEQKGSWANINANRSKNEVKGKVFKLWFNHGVDPVNQSYAYIVKPGVGENFKPSPIKIIANTSVMQAVEHSELHMLQVVFYEAGSVIQNGYAIKVNQPCVLLVKYINTNNPVLHVSDPTQKLTDITINFNTVAASLTFPQGDHKGATVSFQFN